MGTAVHTSLGCCEDSRKWYLRHLPQSLTRGPCLMIGGDCGPREYCRDLDVERRGCPTAVLCRWAGKDWAHKAPHEGKHTLPPACTHVHQVRREVSRLLAPMGVLPSRPPYPFPGPSNHMEGGGSSHREEILGNGVCLLVVLSFCLPQPVRPTPFLQPCRGRRTL